MADKSVVVGVVNSLTGYVEPDFWKPGDRLVDPEGNVISTGDAGATTGFPSNPILWEMVPKNKIDAVRFLAAAFYDNTSNKVPLGDLLSVGPRFCDENFSWATAVPDYLLDAVNSIAAALYAHTTTKIPCPGTADPEYDLNFLGDPTPWDTVPKTVTEAINSLALEMYIVFGKKLSSHYNVFSNFSDSTDIWTVVPYNRHKACQDIALDLAYHLSNTIPASNDIGLDSPYYDQPGIWDSIPNTITDAIESLAIALKLHLGSSIPCNQEDKNGIKYNGDASLWTNIPLTLNEAIRSIASALYIHLSKKLGMRQGVYNYVEPPSTPTSSGVRGQWSFSGGYLYKCITENTWIRFIAVTSW